MRMISGAILILAGAVLWGAATLSHTVQHGQGDQSYYPAPVIALIGLILLIWGLLREVPDRKRAPGTLPEQPPDQSGGGEGNGSKPKRQP